MVERICSTCTMWRKTASETIGHCRADDGYHAAGHSCTRWDGRQAPRRKSAGRFDMEAAIVTIRRKRLKRLNVETVYDALSRCTYKQAAMVVQEMVRRGGYVAQTSQCTALRTAE